MFSCQAEGSGVSSGIAYITEAIQGQSIYLVNGSLTLSLSPDSYPSTTVVRGETDYTVAIYRIAAFHEDLRVTKLAFKGAGNCLPSDFFAVKLMRIISHRYETLAVSVMEDGLRASFEGLDLVIPKGSVFEFRVAVDISSFAESGNDFNFMLDLSGIEAIGLTSGSPVVVSAANYPSSTFTIRCSKAWTSKASDSPSGQVIQNVQGVLGKINVTAVTNIDNSSLTLKSFAVRVADKVTDIRVYTEYIGTVWKNPEEINYEIFPNVTKTFIITGNTIGVPQGTILPVEFYHFVVVDGCGQEFILPDVISSTFIF